MAFDDEAAADQARVGVLVGSAVAAALGTALLRIAARRRPDQDAPQDVLRRPVDPARDHVRGPADAAVTLVEYADFECPFCGKATGSIDALCRQFGPRLRYVFRHAPHTEEHVHARLAAEAAEAAGAQGQFWQMHERLYAHQQLLAPTDLVDHAAALNLDLQRFTRDLGSGQHARRVQEDLRDAETSGASGIPAFFVDGRLHTGQHDAETLAGALSAALGDDGDDGNRVGSAMSSETRAGTRQTVERGDTFYRSGDASYDF